MKVDYREIKDLKQDDMYSTLGNGRTIYRVISIREVEETNYIFLTVQTFDFQLNKFAKVVTKKYTSNETISMRTYGQVLNRVFYGVIK